MERQILEREQLLRAIVAQPERDDLRCRYADWQEAHGAVNHAELIRVQVALARLRQQQVPRRDPERKALRQRELALLALPEFGTIAISERKQGPQYQCGFVDTTNLPFTADETTVLNIVPGVDRVLTFSVTPSVVELTRADNAMWSRAWWAGRIRSIEFLNNWGAYDDLYDEHLLTLAAIPELRHVERLWFFECDVPLVGLLGLLANGPERLRVLQCNSCWPWPDRTDATTMNEFYVGLAALPRLHSLRVLEDVMGVGETGLSALLRSPYLTALREPKIRWRGPVSPALLQHLRDRFGGAW